MPTLREKANYKWGLLVRSCDQWLQRKVDRLRDRYYRRSFTHFGMLEAILFARRIDFWYRASNVLSLLHSNLPRGGMVLEVGAGALSLKEMVGLAGWTGKYRIVPSDLSYDLLKEGVAADAGQLPFRNRTFDAAVSIDMMEHIPAERRGKIIHDLRRVTRGPVIVTLPIRSRSGVYDGERADRQFQEWFERTWGYPEYNTAEHLSRGYPVLEELVQHGGCRVIPLYGNPSWMRYMTCLSAPIRWLGAGFAYWLMWKPLDQVPPYHSCVLVFDER